MDAVLAIDQGTTATTALLVGPDRRVAARASAPTPLLRPRPGWAESAPNAIIDAVESAVRGVLAKVPEARVQAIGITNQRETTLLWERGTLRPLTPAVSWQDRRTASMCRALKATPGVEAMVRARTGLVLDPYFSGTKVRWLLENDPTLAAAARKDGVCFGTIDAFLVAALTGEHATDASNASRTMLLDTATGAWDAELAALLKVPPGILPRVVASSGEIGPVANTTPLGSRLPALHGVPVAGVAGDQQASLFGHGCLEPGDTKGTLGTGAFFLVNAGAARPDPPPGVLGTIAWDIGDGPVHALEGVAFSCGSALEWLSTVGLLPSPDALDATAQGAEDAGGVAFVPALYGLAAPHWDPDARGAFVGLSASTTRTQLARAAAEGLAAQNALLLDTMRLDDARGGPVKVDGGVARSDLLCRLMADATGRTIARADDIDVTGLGAAFLAGLGVGLWERDALGVPASQRFEPAHARPAFLDAYRRAVDRIASRGA